MGGAPGDESKVPFVDNVPEDPFGTGYTESRPLRDIVTQVAEDAHDGLQSLLEDGSIDPPALLSYIHQTRQRLLHTLALVRWSSKARALSGCTDAMEGALSHVMGMNRVAAAMHRTVLVDSVHRWISAPPFAAGTAWAMLAHSEFPCVPDVASALGARTPSDRSRAAARSHLDTLIARELSSRDLPPGVAVTRLGDGTAEIACPGLYTATLTLAPLHLSADLVRMRRRAAAQRNPSTREDAEPSDGARMVWHWVVQDVSVSPGAALGAQVFPDQAADLVAMLQGHITECHIRHTLGLGFDDLDAARPRPSAPSLPEFGASATTSARDGAESSAAGEATSVAGAVARWEAQATRAASRVGPAMRQGPLHVMHAVLGEVSGGVALSVAVRVAREAISATGRLGPVARVEALPPGSPLASGFALRLRREQGGPGLAALVGVSFEGRLTCMCSPRLRLSTPMLSLLADESGVGADRAPSGADVTVVMDVASVDVAGAVEAVAHVAAVERLGRLGEAVGAAAKDGAGRMAVRVRGLRVVPAGERGGGAGAAVVLGPSEGLRLELDGKPEMSVAWAGRGVALELECLPLTGEVTVAMGGALLTTRWQETAAETVVTGLRRDLAEAAGRVEVLETSNVSGSESKKGWEGAWLAAAGEAIVGAMERLGALWHLRELEDVAEDVGARVEGVRVERGPRGVELAGVLTAPAFADAPGSAPRVALHVRLAPSPQGPARVRSLHAAFSPPGAASCLTDPATRVPCPGADETPQERDLKEVVRAALEWVRSEAPLQMIYADARSFDLAWRTLREDRSSVSLALQGAACVDGRGGGDEVVVTASRGDRLWTARLMGLQAGQAGQASQAGQTGYGARDGEALRGRFMAGAPGTVDLEFDLATGQGLEALLCDLAAMAQARAVAATLERSLQGFGSVCRHGVPLVLSHVGIAGVTITAGGGEEPASAGVNGDVRGTGLGRAEDGWACHSAEAVRVTITPRVEPGLRDGPVRVGLSARVACRGRSVDLDSLAGFLARGHVRDMLEAVSACAPAWAALLSESWPTSVTMHGTALPLTWVLRPSQKGADAAAELAQTAEAKDLLPLLQAHLHCFAGQAAVVAFAVGPVLRRERQRHAANPEPNGTGGAPAPTGLPEDVASCLRMVSERVPGVALHGCRAGEAAGTAEAPQWLSVRCPVHALGRLAAWLSNAWRDELERVQPVTAEEL